MKISKEIRDEALRKIEEVAEKTHLPGEFSLRLVLEVFRPAAEENTEIAEFIDKALETYCEIPVEDPDARRIFFAACLFALADMFRRQAEVNRLEEQFGK